VALPAGGFLQPSLEGEALLTRLVLDAAGDGAGPIVDLFCGLGTFALAAGARGRPVAGFDADPEQVAALQGTIRAERLADRMSALRRDLFRDPLTPAELEPFALAIIDPPRAGAPAQSEALARSAVPAVAALSCNPQSFARDAARLAAGGYRLDRVTPIDQFTWSPHVELMALFRRP
jgi:23S rRNA (uracil1939-C5)-methyltransferase